MLRAARSRPLAILCRHSSSTTTSTAAALNHCVDLVRDFDRERYIANLHAPQEARPGLFAVHAFNCETSKICATVSQEAAGRSRFAWWRDTLERSLAGEPPNHPVARAIAHANQSHSLTRRHLTRLLDAREAELVTKQPRDIEELRLYAERTAGSLLLLGLECAGVTNSEAAENAAAHAGTALGLATLLRGTAAHAQQGSTYLPADVTTRHKANLSQLLRGNASAEICAAVREVADEAVAHLLAARSLQPNVPSDARKVLLPTVVADHILQRLQRHGYSPFAPEVQQPLGPSLQLALLGRRWMGYY